VTVKASLRAIGMTTGASVLALVLAAPAFAQATGAPEASPANARSSSGGLEDIVVTARRVAENLQDVPVAVTVLTSADLEKRSVVRLQDIASFTPGLYMRSGSSTPAAITLGLRGQFQNDVLATLDPSAGTYVDGVYWARAYGLNANMLDIASIQVLKGPQGTLFGRNTTGGALLIKSNDPKLGEFSGRLSASYGRFNEFEPTAVVNVPLGDKVAIRLAGKRYRRDGYTTNSVPAGAASVVTPVTQAVAERPVTGNLNGLKLDNRDRWQGRAKILVQPTETLRLIGSAEYFRMHERAPARSLTYPVQAFTGANPTYNTANSAAVFVGLLSGATPATAGATGLGILQAEAARLNGDPTITANNEIPYAFAKTQTYGLNAALETGWGEIQLITGYRKIKSYAGFDLDGTAFPIHFTEGQQELNQKSAEVQFTGKALNDRLDFVVGAFVFKEKGYDQSISIALPTLNPVTNHFYGIVDHDSIGMYGQGTFSITDQIAFTGGLRYSVDDKGLETRNNNFNRNNGTTICSVVVRPAYDAGGEVVGAPECAYQRRDSFSGISYTAGIDYKPNDDILLYAKTAKGFRSGGQNLRAPSTAAFLPFKPEVAYAYEIGFKGEFLDRRLRVNLAAYTTDVKGIQRSTLVSVPPIPPATVPGSATLLGNAGKVRIRGVEAEVTARLFEGFTLQVSGALVDPKYIEYADLSGDRSFERFSGVAEEQFSIGADYTTALSPDAEINLHVDYDWRGDVPLDIYYYEPNPRNAEIVAATTGEAYGMVNARASVRLADRYEFGVFGRNLTNERPFTQNQPVLPLGYISATRQEPRTYGVTASVEF
jgi:iron complex outermembrane receptor protein